MNLNNPADESGSIESCDGDDTRRIDVRKLFPLSVSCLSAKLG